MKNLVFILLISLAVFSCGSRQAKKHNKRDGVDATLAGLKQKKAAIDKYLLSHQGSLLLFAKLGNKDALVQVKNDEWPDSTVCSYNVLKDDSGRVILVGEVPFSESGDWNIEHRHYFGPDGKTFAFTNTQSRFIDEVPGGILWQKIQVYYDGDFNIIAQENKLTDNKDKPLPKPQKYYDLMDDRYHVYKTADECLKAYHINKAVF
jgi:hypothetical protein